MDSFWIYLSYYLDVDSPAYGGGNSISILPEKEIIKGDSCNTSRWSFKNHLGTHIDFPKHFHDNDRTLSDYPAKFWIFNSISLIDISTVGEGAIIDANSFEIDPIDPYTEFLIIKTGYCKFRDQKKYWQNNPGLSPQLAIHLRKHLKKLKVIGLDSISLSSYMEREIGRDAHKEFLGGSHPILILEDMDLNFITYDTIISKVIIAPLLVANADASPCNVIAEIIDGEQT